MLSAQKASFQSFFHEHNCKATSIPILGRTLELGFPGLWNSISVVAFIIIILNMISRKTLERTK